MRLLSIILSRLSLAFVDSWSKMTPKEKKNKSIGYSISVGLHLLLLMVGGAAIMAWKAPGPPAEFPEVGIVFALGSDLQGKESEEVVEDSESESESESDSQEESTESEETPETTPTDDVPDPTSEPVTSDPEPTDTPVDNTTTETNTEPSKVQNTSTSEPKESATNPTKSSTKSPKVFKGDDNEAGNKGEENGSPDVKTYDKGKQGSGSLGQTIGNIPGFGWKEKPKMDKVPFDATVKMKVVVNNLGEIITVKFVECPYTDPSVRRKIEEELKKAKLEATTQPDGNTVADIVWVFKGK